MNRNLILAAMAVVGMTFASCGKESDENEGKEPEVIKESLTDQEMYEALLCNDRLRSFGLNGEVKTMVSSTSYVSTWENNAVKPGYFHLKTSYEFNQAGRVTKQISENSRPILAEWINNELVVTNGLKPNYVYNYAYDEKNRVKEYLYQYTFYRCFVGNYAIFGDSYSLQFTIPYSSISSSAQYGDPFSMIPESTWIKKTIDYDDKEKTAILIEYTSNDGKTYTPVKKYVCQQDQYGQINLSPDGGLSDSEGFNAVKATTFEDSPSTKTVVKRDDQNNRIESYVLKYETGQTIVDYHQKWNYTYY